MKGLPSPLTESNCSSGRTDPDRSSALNTAFFIVNVDGTDLQRITPRLLSDAVRIDESSWSPDGRWIPYDRDHQIHAVRPDGSRIIGSGSTCPAAIRRTRSIRIGRQTGAGSSSR
jgi:hypothetical protein